MFAIHLMILMPLKIRAERDRMFIEIENEEKMNVLMERLPEVFGIQSFSPVASCEKDMDEIKALAIQIMEIVQRARNYI